MSEYCGHFDITLDEGCDSFAHFNDAEDYVGFAQAVLGLRVLNFYSSLAELTAAVPNPALGDAYGVGTAGNYDIYVAAPGQWVNNGSIQGPAGVSPTVTVTTITGGHRVTITDATGTHVFDVMDGAGAVTSVNGRTGTVVLDAEDVGALPDDTTIPTALSQLTDDSTHRLVTDTEKSTWSGKQDALGFTPYNATNPAGYQTAEQVTTAINAAIGDAIGGSY